MRRVNALAFGMIILASGFWGMTYPLAKIAAEDGADPVGLTLWRLSGSAVLMLAISGLFRCLPKLNRQSVFQYFVVGMIGTALPTSIYFLVAPKIPAGVHAIAIIVVPILTYVASLAMRIDTFSAKRMSGITLGFCAVLLLVLPDASLPDPTMGKWVLISLIASIFYTYEGLYVDSSVPDDQNMLSLLAGGFTLGTLRFIPVVAVTDAWVPMSFHFGKVEWAVTAIVVISCIAYLTFFYAIKLAGAVFASQTGYMTMAWGVFGGMVFLNERHSMFVWFAFALLFAGVALVSPRGRN